MSSKCNPSGKEQTYEQIGHKLKISPQQVHKIEREAFNKIIRRVMEKNNMDIFDSIIYFSKLFGVEVEQCYKKLDKVNLDLLNDYLKDNK